MDVGTYAQFYVSIITYIYLSQYLFNDLRCGFISKGYSYIKLLKQISYCNINSHSFDCNKI